MWYFLCGHFGIVPIVWYFLCGHFGIVSIVWCFFVFHFIHQDIIFSPQVLFQYFLGEITIGNPMNFLGGGITIGNPMNKQYNGELAMVPITLLVLCDDSMTINCLFWTDTLLTDNKNVDI